MSYGTALAKWAVAGGAMREKPEIGTNPCDLPELRTVRWRGLQAMRVRLQHAITVDSLSAATGAAGRARGEPFADKTVILDLAGFGAVRAKVMILAGNGDDGLPTGAMALILRR